MIKVFTDGSCINNGKPNAMAGIGIYFGENDNRNVSRKIEGKQSNNTAELLAVIEVFNILKSELENNEEIIIYCDSEYTIRWCKDYGEKCKNNNWKRVCSNGKLSDIPNVELGKELYLLYNSYENIKIKYIRAHTKLNDEISKGNEGADNLAYQSLNLVKENNNHYKKSNKIYLDIPYEKKDISKKYGAKWNPKKKKWYYEGTINDINLKKLIELQINK